VSRGRPKEGLELPLLAEEHLQEGQLGAGNPLSQSQASDTDQGVTSAGGASAAAAAAAASRTRESLALAAEYDPVTGMPANTAAGKLVVFDWSTGERSSVVNLPFQLLRQATLGFADFHQLGTGASCVVFKGLVFGESVAIKVRLYRA
jgi:hypothetical protein